MSDPRRILDENERRDPGAALKQSMLRAARQEAAPPAAQQDLLAALGLGDSAVSARPPARPPRERAVDWWTPPTLFASILRGEKLDPRRYGKGALASAMVHAAVFALALHGMSSATTPIPEAAQAMVQLSAKPAVSLPPGVATAPLGEPSPVRDPEAHTAPPERGDRVAAREIEGSRAGNPAVRISSPDEIATGADSRSPAARVTPEAKIADAPDLAKAGSPAGAGPLPSSEILPFGEGMNLPRLINGPEPAYPREAREARVEGTLLAKCVITTEGALRSCRIIKSLPFLDEPVLAALARRRYAPVMFQGHAVNVEYVISLRFELP
jgi:periplasmic protein TonB